MKKAWQNFITQFKPRYTVKVTNYHLIPFKAPVVEERAEEFGKGEYVAAKKYFDKVVHTTHKANVKPTEINLIKGKKTVMHLANLGPVDQLKDFNRKWAAGKS